MPKRKRSKTPITATPRLPNTSTTSSTAATHTNPHPRKKLSTTARINLFHALTKKLALLRKSNQNDPDIQDIEKQIESIGGLDAYQRASLKGGDERSGRGACGKWLVEFLGGPLGDMLRGGDLDGVSKSNVEAGSTESSDSRPKPASTPTKPKLRLLDVGALNGTTYAKQAGWIDAQYVDLNPQNVGVTRQDFFERPIPKTDAQRFHAICLSLVLNFVDDPERRGLMLHLAYQHLLPSGLLFLVLPLPCTTNSRYMTHAHLKTVASATGFEEVAEKKTPRLSYHLWRRVEGSVEGAEVAKKMVNPGAARNNFSVVVKPRRVETEIHTAFAGMSLLKGRRKVSVFLIFFGREMNPSTAQGKDDTQPGRNVLMMDCETVSNSSLDDMLEWIHTAKTSSDRKILLFDNADTLLAKDSKLFHLKEALLHILDTSNTLSNRLNSVFVVIDSSDRLQILEAILSDMKIPLNQFDFLETFCDTAYGMVGADIKHVVDSVLVSKENVCILAFVVAIECDESLNVLPQPEEWTQQDFEAEKNESTVRLKPIKPLRDFNDFFGMNQIQQRVKDIILDPWRLTIATKDAVSLAPRGVLIYGPSGTGKTQFGMALAQEIGFNQVVVNGSDIRSKIVGESEANIRKIFEDVRQKSPCVLFIDQLDAVVPMRGGGGGTSEGSGNRIVTSFLTEMDGILAASQTTSHLIIIAVTNRKDAIDPAILRPGRINEFLYIAAPQQQERAELFRGFLTGVPHNVTDSELTELGMLSEGCSGADIENYCREAAFVCMRKREDAENPCRS
ncbi:Cell division control protein 48 B [Podochytrium sp. JEL0797]|nr:Cell division control protein 48 B [Podochytrium sp. JEL0797]